MKNRRTMCKEIEIRTLVIGTGAAGYATAVRLHQCGVQDLAILTENRLSGTSRNTGSDKQTYYKLSLAGREEDSVRIMAEDLFRGQCVDGDLALCEAALSAKCFYYLAELGVPFPDNEYGEAVGYQTDHDRKKRASSAGPYTSRIMTECLEREALRRQIPILDQIQVIRILVKNKKICGVLCLNRGEKNCGAFLIVWCENAVLATGGPAGMYRDSVYPVSQLGSSGIAFEAGAAGKNLTEWQFGMASLNPRWNVSGTYMQVLPRFLSTDQEGNGEKEFLLDYFERLEEVQFLTFMKGYQWPFDSGKIYGGSSLIDLLIYQETILRKRRVFLDFLNNPGGGAVAFDQLPEETYKYLHSAGACFGTPIERLLHINEPAYLFYLEHGVDLKKEKLEIAVCVQHNNGGLSVDCHWQTNVDGLFAVGEVCGSHGVTRPGGTALNAGQVGAVRAAEYIAFVKMRKPWQLPKETKEFCRKVAEMRIQLSILRKGEFSLGEIWEKAILRMSRVAGMIRKEDEMEEALKETTVELQQFGTKIRITDYRQAGMLYHLLDLLISQKVYLSAMVDYIRCGGGSRGSALYTCPDGEKPGEKMPELFRCKMDEGRLGGMVQEIRLVQVKAFDTDRKEEMEREVFSCQVNWRPVRPIPEVDYFFENQWRVFRRRRGETGKGGTSCGTKIFTADNF